LEIGDSTGGVFATVTMNVTFVLCVCPPLVPLMVTVFVPAGVEPEVGDRERRSSSAVERRRIEAGDRACWQTARGEGHACAEVVGGRHRHGEIVGRARP
jgi:hypothetical protein